jgi:acetyl-CoA carboxylase biotin carboxylase subunit
VKKPAHLKRLLIANRGEIAVRIIRACHEMGIEAVAVYSTADKDSLHVRLADKAICIGPPPSAKSYLDRSNLVMAAINSECEAIHPGAGFLSESASFAKFVRDRGLIFIGPDPEVIELLGDKVIARDTARRFALPVTPGTKEAVDDPHKALEAVREIGLPVIIKAAAGGGGKGMRIVRREEDLAENLSIAGREAEANFADGRVFIERYLENPRHVELQIIADGSGTVAVLGERDCTVQKHHQKLIEESPSPAVDDDMRRRMSEGASAMFRELKYRGAGTIEFLAEKSEFYFMEVNARVQVEHPVSEFVSGVDIIRQQILACSEGKIDKELEEFDAKNNGKNLRGHAIECRINALSPGKISRLEIPGGPGVRFDSFIYQGCTVPPHYDSMVAKLIVHNTDREAAIARMIRALNELCIEGIKTNINQQRWVMRSDVFKSGDFATSWYETIAKEAEYE